MRSFLDREALILGAPRRKGLGSTLAECVLEAHSFRASILAQPGQ